MKEKKKIIFVITKSVWGGAGRYVFDLAKAFHAKGYDVKVAMGGNGLLAKRLQEAQIHTIEIPGLARDIAVTNEFKAFLFLIKLFRKEKPDIIHLNSSKAGLGALAGRLAGVRKIVFTLHGLALNEDRPWWQKIIITEIYRITIHLCHITIAVSNAVSNQLTKRLPRAKKKITVIHNGVSIEHLFPRTEAKEKLIDLIREQGKSSDLQIASLFIGNVAELHSIKGQTYLLEGFREALSDSALPLYLFIMGEGEERSHLEEKIKELRLEGHVFLCGHVKNAIHYLKAFDIFILPSLSEALPYAIGEAGCASLPVIASAVGGIPEVIEDGENGILIKPKSITDITDAILELVFDPVMRKTLGSNLHKKISEEFSIQKMVEETEKLYRK
ncbi:MAG: glycosyltransferase family 4 protein [Patescibacteria group bacterium]